MSVAIRPTHTSQRPHPTPTRRRTLSSASTKSSSTSGSKRSPSPAISFTATNLAASPKGVTNITNRVIKTLEGLGHVEILGMSNSDGGLDERDEVGSHEVESSLQGMPPNGHTVKEASSPFVSMNGNPPQPKKIDWEIPRKTLHSSIGFFTLYLYLSQGAPRSVIIALWSSLAIILPADFLRFHNPDFAKFYEQALGFLMRESEREQINGVVWYIIGANLVLMLLPLDIAVVSILILSWCDTAASVIGRLWGSKTPALPRRLPFLRLPLAPRKSSAGFLAAFVTGAAIAFGFWGFIAPLRANPDDITWSLDGGVRQSNMVSMVLPKFPTAFSGWAVLTGISLWSGLVSAVAEALDLGSVDDNLSLPIISGGCLYLTFKVMSFLASGR